MPPLPFRPAWSDEITRKWRRNPPWHENWMVVRTMTALEQPRHASIHRDELDHSLGRDPDAYAALTGRDTLEDRFQAFADVLPRDPDGTLFPWLVTKRHYPMCTCTESRVLFVKYGFSTRACRFCAFEYTGPMLDQKKVQSGALGNPDLSRAHMAFISQPVYRACAAKRFEFELQLMLSQWRQPRPPRRFLEIGASTGVGLEVARAYGLETIGIEPNAQAAAVAEAAGHHIVQTPFVPGCVPDTTFDLIMTLDVLEHVADPLSFLDSLQQALVPGGLALVQVPNTGSLIVWLDGPKNQIFNGLIHLNYFNARSLDRAAQRTGLEHVHTTSFLSELGKIKRFPQSQISAAIADKAPAYAADWTLHQDWINDHGLGYKLLGIYRRPERRDTRSPIFRF